MKEMTVSNIKINIVRKNIKNIHLGVYPPAGRVRIAAPLKINDEAIRLFAISKIGWIKRQQKKFEGQERISLREYKNRESHYFQGKRYLLNVIETDSKPKVILKNKTYINLYIEPKTTMQKRHEIMIKWYRSHLKTQIPEIIDKWEMLMNIKVNEWQIKQMKTKWGSCNIEKKKLWLNLELAKKPEHCLEYIIVHEMIHLLERHHNDNFIYYLDKYLPNWKQLKIELNRMPVSHADWKY